MPNGTGGKHKHITYMVSITIGETRKSEHHNINQRKEGWLIIFSACDAEKNLIKLRVATKTIFTLERTLKVRDLIIEHIAKNGGGMTTNQLMKYMGNMRSAVHDITNELIEEAKKKGTKENALS